MKRFFYLFFTLHFIFRFEALGQVDIAKYASEDLFSPKHVITQEYLEQKSKENSPEEVVNSHFEALISEGMEYWSNGEYDDALTHFENMAAEYDEATFHYYIGLINYETKRYDEAVESFREVLNKDPLLLEAKYMLGMTALEQKDHKTAKDHFQLLTEIPKYVAFGEHGMGLLAMEQGNAYLASRKFKKSIDADPTFLEAYIPYISLDIYFGNVKRARKTAEQGIGVDSEWQRGIVIRAILALLVDEDFDQFEADINTLIRLDPSNYHYYFTKAFLEMELKRYSEAVRMFHTAYNLGVDDSRTGEFKFSSKFKRDEAYLRSLNYYFDQKNLERPVRNQLDQGICKLLTDNKKDALLHFDSANAINESAVAYMLIGIARKSSFGKLDTSIEAFSKSIEIDSNNWAAYSYRAELLMDKGDVQPAFSDYSKVIEIKPKVKEGYKNRGIILLESGQYKNAYKDFSYGVAIDPTDYDLFFNRAVASFHLNSTNEAVKDLRYILKNKPNDGEAHYFLHECLLKTGDTTRSILHLDSASLYSKYNEDYHNQLLKMAEEQSRPDLCLAAHDRLVKYKSWNYRYLLNRAKFFYQTGEYAKAIKDLEKYLKKEKNSGEGYYYLACSFREEGNVKEGEKYLKKAKKLGYSEVK